MTDKTLPSENSDYSLPGRIEESNSAYFGPPDTSKPKSRSLVAASVIFVAVSAGFLSYYLANQGEIDSQILDNALPMSLEQRMVSWYGVGQLGSDHDHAAMAVFVNGVQVDFGMSQFQLQSRYIHFEDHNPYLVHKHATNVPLKMLFSSFGLGVTSECLGFGHGSGERLR